MKAIACELPKEHGLPLSRFSRAELRLQGGWPNLILVHLPLHASWLNQIEICCSIVQRKALKPNNFPDLAALARTLNAFEHHWNEVAQPFHWSYTRRHDLATLMERLSGVPPLRWTSAD